MESSVEIIQQPVPDCDCVLGCSHGQRPAVVFLANRSVSSVVPHEWIESTKSCPSRAQGFCRVSRETADIGTNHGNLENGVEVEDAGNREAVLRPLRNVVAEPLSKVRTKANELFKYQCFLKL